MASDYAAISNNNVKQLGLNTKSRKSQINLYSDSTHFIFEILQNADDHGATEILFLLMGGKLIIEHNGIPFNEQNVEAITFIGESTSEKDITKTGRFGIGFKSVFAFTATPIIISGEESFQIYDLFKLRQFDRMHYEDPEKTYIILPFNHMEHTPDYIETHLSKEEAYSKISNRLKNLDKKTILFTKNLRTIHWKTLESQGIYSRTDEFTREHRITHISDDLSGNESKYLVFSNSVEWNENGANKQYNPVEVAFYLNKNLQIILGPSFLYVLFSTIQETHLKFIINGPFRTNPSRESIAHDDPFNLHLIKLVEEMWPEILHTLKSKEFLTIGTLNALPNEDDELPSFYKPIRKKIFDQFQEYEYLPAEDGSFASVEDGIPGPKKLKQLFSNEDLSFLSGRDLKWLKNPQPNSRASHFFRSLDIQSWGWKDLVDILEDKFTDPSGSWNVDEEKLAEFRIYAQWLIQKEGHWLQRFYMELADACTRGTISKRYDYRTGSYSLPPIGDIHLIVVETVDGLDTQSISSSRFPKEGYTGCVAESILQHEDEEIKTQIRESLEALGVTEINEEDEIKILLDRKYSGDSDYELNEDWEKEHFQDIKRFTSYYLENNNTNIFNGYQFLLISDGVRLEFPRKIYLDEPFASTGLNHLYELSIEGLEDKSILCPIYIAIYDDEFSSFLEDLGVQLILPIHEVSTNGNPHRDKLRSGFYGSRETDTKIDRDYTIECLSDILAVGKVELAKLVYDTVRMADHEVLTAQFRPNQEWSRNTAPSQLVSILSTASWLPTNSGEFMQPRFVNEETLHEAFEFDNRNSWLDAIGFNGLPDDEDEEEIAQKRGYASVEEMKEWDQLRQEAIQNGMSVHDLRRSWTRETPERPVLNPRNIDKTRTKTLKEYQKSPSKSYTSKVRTARDISTNEKRKRYLKKLNTNSQDEMICQLCHEVMPFKYNGEYYFEAVEILDRKRLPKEYFKQYLALCPNCAAKYKLFIKQNEKKLEALAWAIKELIVADSSDEIGDDLEILLELDVEGVLWFTKKQIVDLKVILEEQDE